MQNSLEEKKGPIQPRGTKEGSFLIAVGALLLAASLCLAGFNMFDQARAERLASDAARQLASGLEARGISDDVPAYVMNPDMEMPVKTIGSWGYIAVLSIPSQGLELPVIESWSYPALREAPCRYTGSAYSNDLVIAAHNYRTHFGALKSVEVGEEICLQDMDGNLFVYRVGAYEVLQPSDIEDMTDSGWDLTLFTCTLGGQYRQTLRCELVESGNPLV